MNTSTVSNFFSRDLFLRRQVRTHKRPTHTNLCPSTSSTNKPLPMIMEEDEPRPSFASLSRSPSPATYAPSTPTQKSKRRHANLTVSDIRLARSALVHDDSDFTQQNSPLLSSPRPAPRPPVATPSPEPSPDPFSLQFPDGSLRFPHPPIPTPSLFATFEQHRTGSESPTPSMSSCSSTSPESRSTGLPTTPSSSDDEFFSYYSSPLPSFNARRVSIKPLVITKHHSMSSPSENFPSISTSPFKNANETTALSPLFEENTDEEESDSEWYNQEFSKILTLCSPLPPIAQKSRPESLCVPSSSTSSTPPKTTTTRPRGFPSAQLDPAFPRRRSRIIPTYPPPPVPVVPEHLRSPPATPPKPSRARCNALTLTPPPVRRPPPRSSIPADCVLVDETFTFSDDTASTFSLSLYDSSPSPAAAESPKSFYSQQSFQLPASPLPPSFPSTPVHSSTEFDFPVGVDEHEIQFAMDMDMDRPMLLPLSLPTSPIDLARDIATGLEALRAAPQPQHPSPATHDANVVTAPARTSTKQQRRRPDADSDSRELRSRWSSSTLGSIHEEHARRTGTSSGLGGAASAKLRAVFGALPASPGPKTVRMRTSRRSDSVSGAGSAIPQTPVTPTSPAPGKRFRHARRESDVMALGYGYVPVVSPLRRRGSTSPSVSDAGSEESASSAGSSGLRRKPIPVEMFLRSA